MRKFNWLILYDICDAKRLSKVAKITEGYGVRVQNSLFEAVASEATIKELRKRLDKVIDNGVDYVVIFKLCEDDWSLQQKFGPEKFEILEELVYKII